MRVYLISFLLVASPALALNEGLQCVPYARALSGVQIRGDAHEWWGKAAGHYERGNRPRVGAVMSFHPYGKMRLGHVAAVRRIIDNRTIIISHANWSTINGHRGHIEQNVRAVDVSEANDWSRVRVWYTPNAALGGTAWPVNGFIYPSKKLSDKEAHKAVVALLGAKAPKMLPAGTDGPYFGKDDKEIKLAKSEKPDAKSKLGQLEGTKKTKVEVKFAKADIDNKAVKAKTGGFTLSTKLLAEVDKRAAKEVKVASGKGLAVGQKGR